MLSTLYAFNIMISHRERLAVFYERLRNAASCASHDAAFALLSVTLTEVEDELSGAPNRVENHLHDGRMYPPLPDNTFTVKGRPELTRYRSRGHQIYISDQGALLIAKSDGSVELSKPSANGEEIEL